jgi:hypothetical protein
MRSSKPIAELHIVRTSEGCLSFRLIAQGRTVFTTRSFDFAPARDEARRRVAAWAAKHQYTIVDARQQRQAAHKEHPHEHPTSAR